MTESEQMAWLAGLLEGEGCFSVHRDPRSNSYPQVSVGMYDRDVIERAAVLMGSRVCGILPRGHQRKPTYSTSVTGARAVALMNKLLPLMGERRRARMEEILRGQA